MTSLETRVDQLATQTAHATETGLTAAREALTAREAHQQNIELLNALRQTQLEQGQTLDEHTRTLDEHTRTLAEHTRILDEHSHILTAHSGRLDSHDARLDSIDARLDSIDDKLGALMLGMHTVESLLRRLASEN
ncbi:MAG: hypothetical protein ACR2MA_06350 [Egibacteraceae bacterium]